MLKNLKTYWLLPWVLAFVLGCQKEKVPEPQIAKASETPATYLDSTMLPPEPLFCIEKEALNLSKEEFHKRIQGRWIAVQRMDAGDISNLSPDTIKGSFFVLRIDKDSLTYYDNTFSRHLLKNAYELTTGPLTGNWIIRSIFDTSTGSKQVVYYYLCPNGNLTQDQSYAAGHDSFISFKPF